MASVYRRRRKRKDGTVSRDRRYTIAYKDESGAWSTAAGYTDRRASLELARRLEARAERVLAGLPVEEAERLLLDTHGLVGGWLAELERRGAGAGHLKQCRRYVARAAERCGFKSLGDWRADRYAAWLAGEAKARGWSDRTSDCHLQRAREFLNWCVQRGHLSAHPLVRVRYTRRPRKKKPRRAMTPAERDAFLAAAPACRQAVYRVAVLSGLRLKELRLLEVRDLDLGPTPRWRLRAEATKSRRNDVVPMLPECAELLRASTASLPPTARVFRRVPKYSTFNRDLARAGLTKVDHTGRSLTFHSLRYTFCTDLARRLPVQRVRQLMRHGSIKMTMDLYADLGVDDLFDEVAKLPRILGG